MNALVESQPAFLSRPVWRPSSFTQYINGRTASREENFPTPSLGGHHNDKHKCGEMLTANSGLAVMLSERMGLGELPREGPFRQSNYKQAEQKVPFLMERRRHKSPSRRRTSYRAR